MGKHLHLFCLVYIVEHCMGSKATRQMMNASGCFTPMAICHGYYLYLLWLPPWEAYWAMCDGKGLFWLPFGSQEGSRVLCCSLLDV